MLVRKVIELRDGKYAYEEVTITPNADTGVPTVHSKAYKIPMWDLKEEVTRKEELIRLTHRPMPNVIAFSLYFRKLASGSNHLSIVENTIWKPNLGSWTALLEDWKDRRDLSRYLRQRWLLN